MFRAVESRLSSSNFYNIDIENFLIESTSSNHSLDNNIFIKNHLTQDFFMSFSYDNVLLNRFFGMMFFGSLIKFENSNVSILSTILKQKITDNFQLKESLILFEGTIDSITIKYSVFTNHVTIKYGAVTYQFF